MNTVNTWWYATSSMNDLNADHRDRWPDSVQAITGLPICNAGVATYSAFPDPLPAGTLTVTSGY